MKKELFFLLPLILANSFLFAQAQEQPKQTGGFRRMSYGFGIDAFNGNNIRVNNPAFFFDWLYRTKSKSLMAGLEFETSLFYNGANKERASSTPFYILKNGLGLVAWQRVVEKEHLEIYLGGGASSSGGESNFDYSKWMAGVRCEFGQQYLRLGYRHYSLKGASDQNMVFLTFGTTF